MKLNMYTLWPALRGSIIMTLVIRHVPDSTPSPIMHSPSDFVSSAERYRSRCGSSPGGWGIVGLDWNHRPGRQRLHWLEPDVLPAHDRRLAQPGERVGQSSWSED